MSLRLSSDILQNPNQLTKAELARLTESSWTFLNHLDVVRDPFTERYGYETFEDFFNVIKQRILESKPVWIANVGPSASGKSTIKKNLRVALLRDEDIRRHKKKKVLVTTTQWSDLIKAYAYVSGHSYELGRLTEDFKDGTARMGICQLTELTNAVSSPNHTPVIIADFPGYPGNRGGLLAEFIAQNDGFVCAPWAEDALYRMSAQMRDLARSTVDPAVVVEFLKRQMIPIIGSPEDIHRELSQDCAPGFAVLEMQDQIKKLALEVIEQEVLPTGLEKLPLHLTNTNDYRKALEDPRYLEVVMISHVIPTLLKGWGFSSDKAFIPLNRKMLGAIAVTDSVLNNI